MLGREGPIVQGGTVIITSLAVLLVAGCGGTSGSAGGGSDEVVVTLGEQNGSGVSGTATLTAVGDKTRVVLDVQSRSATAAARPQPAHIHEGSCDNIAPEPKYGLSNVVAGKSTTTVDATFSDLTDGALSINVHKSAQQMGRYVACGDFGARASESPPGYDKETDY